MTTNAAPVTSAWLLAATVCWGFAVAQAAALVRGLTIGCGCFGIIAGEKITWWTVARSVGLIAVLIGLALAGKGMSTSDMTQGTS